MLLKSVPERGAVIAWAPRLPNLSSRLAGPLLAVASKEGGGGGFDDYGGELSLHAIDAGSASLACPPVARCVDRCRTLLIAAAAAVAEGSLALFARVSPAATLPLIFSLPRAASRRRRASAA